MRTHRSRSTASSSHEPSTPGACSPGVVAGGTARVHTSTSASRVGGTVALAARSRGAAVGTPQGEGEPVTGGVLDEHRDEVPDVPGQLRVRDAYRRLHHLDVEVGEPRLQTRLNTCESSQLG